MPTRIHYLQINTDNVPENGQVLGYNSALDQMQWLTVSGISPGSGVYFAGDGLNLDGDIFSVDETFNFDWTGTNTFSNDIEVQDRDILRYSFMLGIS